MEIIPAIDIKDGLCVRLYQGDYAQMTVYDTEPGIVAQRWQQQGATRLHIVDLDGAKQGYPVNISAIRSIVHAVNIPVELGGGLRTEKDIESILALGVSQTILGTVAVQQPDLVKHLVKRFGSSIIVGVDARDGYVATSGWTEVAQVKATDLVDQMARLGVRRIIYTDIARDGTLTEPNYTATADLLRPNGPDIIASGGVAQLSHVLHLARLGVHGVIIGKALYTGAIHLPDLLEALDVK